MKTAENLTATIRGVWCEAEATHRTDAGGGFTEIYVATTDGYPMLQAFIDGHLTDVEVRTAVADLAAGKRTDVAWTDPNVAFAA